MAEENVEEKVERAVKQLFSADLELTAIHPKVARYRVTGLKGLDIIGLHHIEVDRENLPKGDDFNMDFINMDLPKDAPKKMVKQQAAFRMYKNLAMKICMV